MIGPEPGTIGARIRERRLERSYTLGTLGEMVGLTESHMSLIEHNKRGLSLDRAMRLADALGCSIEDIYRPSPVLAPAT